jgi:uncharacterized protein YukE
MGKPEFKGKEVFRFSNDSTFQTIYPWLKQHFNSGKYRLRKRGRKPDNEKLRADGMRVGCYGSDGHIPDEYATEIVLYIEGIEQVEREQVQGQRLGECLDRIATLEGENDRLTRENNCNRELAKEWMEKYQQSQAMVMELEDNLHHMNSLKQERNEALQYRESFLSRGEAIKKLNTDIEWLTDQNKKLKERLLEQSQQMSLLKCTVNDLNNNEQTMHDRLNNAQDIIDDLQTKVSRLERSLEMMRKLKDKYRKYFNWYTMTYYMKHGEKPKVEDY